MNTSLRLGTIAGIRVQIHWTFWLLILFVITLVLTQGGTFEQMLWSTAFILLLFICVVMHEFGHALTARSYGIETRSITLLPIGGVASLKEMPEDPKAEFLIAIAGPAVNLVIAFLLYLVLPLETFLDREPEALQEELSMVTADNIFFYLFFANGALALFNMLPAFPLDGGRVVRAILSIRLGRVQATRMAAGLGKFLAVALFLLGLFYNFILALIAVFIYFGAESENMMVMQLNLLEGHTVREAMITRFTALSPEDTLDDVVEHVLKGTERDFVVTDESEVKGVLYMSDLAEAINRSGRQTLVREVMDRDFVTLSPHDPLTRVYRRLQGNRKNFFPVMEDHRIAGIIDMNNMDEFLRLRASLDY